MDSTSFYNAILHVSDTLIQMPMYSKFNTTPIIDFVDFILAEEQYYQDDLLVENCYNMKQELAKYPILDKYDAVCAFGQFLISCAMRFIHAIKDIDWYACEHPIFSLYYQHLKLVNSYKIANIRMLIKNADKLGTNSIFDKIYCDYLDAIDRIIKSEYNLMELLFFSIYIE